jgi:hypothetical protein
MDLKKINDFYFVFPLRRSAQRFFMRSDSFLRPAAVKRLPLRSGALLAVGSPLAVFAALFIAAYLRFMASEIFFLAERVFVMCTHCLPRVGGTLSGGAA